MGKIIIVISLCLAIVGAMLAAGDDLSILLSGIETDFMNDHRNELLSQTDLPGAYKKVLDSMKEEIKTCDGAERYRRADGTCNNLKYPLQGAPLHIQPRLLDSAYDDGKGSPRMVQKDNSKLPSARVVSSKIFLPNEETDTFLDGTITQMSMQWGQYIDHDISFTAVMQGSDCCSSLDHPDINNGGPCFPIEIPGDDSYYQTSCMAFKRSFAVFDDNDVRQQISGITSYIDASTVYGSSQVQQDDLRSHVDGMLKVDEGQKLPAQGEFKCRKELVQATHCPHAGDTRVNVFPGLTSLHLLFVREHNRLAADLAKINPHWDDERIFQEARKIVIALHQIITYEEYLTHIIGKTTMRLMNIRRGSYYYDENTSANVLNPFTTAAFRFGHSQINKFLSVNGAQTEISKIFFQPWKAQKSEEQIVELMTGQCTDRVQKTDNFISDQVTNLLFLDVDAPGHSTDLGARNIQRGRDHGLKPFWEYQKRALQRLRPKHSKWPMSGRCKFDVYNSDEDIDLFVGGLCEQPLEDAVVGPTFAYIIGEQFRRLKFGDRFFFETDNETRGFTKKQKKELNKVSLAGTICHNTETSKLQPDVFHVISPSNNVKECEDYPKIDLTHWKETNAN